jgi:hypothetical protein
MSPCLGAFLLMAFHLIATLIRILGVWTLCNETAKRSPTFWSPIPAWWC